MRLFLVSFFVVYGLMHVYAFLKARSGLGLGWTWGLPLALLMAVMFLAPLIVWFLEMEGLETAARALSLTGYMWLGVLFLFFSVSFCLDLYGLILSGAGFILKKDTALLDPTPRTAFVAALGLAVAFSIYGYFEALDIRTEKVTVRTSKLPPGIERLRIAQISDVHVGLIVREKRLRMIIEKVKSLEPDIFVSTGDLVDGQINRLSGLAELIQEVNPRFGKYAITGNHEFYAGLDQALAFTKSSGFEVLRGEAVSGVINIAGVEDSTGRYFDSNRLIPESDLLSVLPRDKFTLLLKHRPEVDRSAQGLFDLQLSGHTHKGQIFPFYLVTLIPYPATGNHDLAEGSVMYLSRGTGTWGPPVRVLAPPEITLIELVRE